MAKQYKAVATILIRGDQKAFNNQMKKLKSDAMRHGADIQKSLFQGLALAAPLAVAVKLFASFEQELANVSKIAKIFDEDLERMGDGIKQMASDSVFGTDALLSVAGAAARLGVTGTDNILAYTDAVSKLAAATDFDTEGAAFALARLSNVAGLTEAEVNNLASTFVALGNALPATESELNDSAISVAAAGRSFGITADQALGMAGAFASVGQASFANGTAVGNFFSELGKATREGGAQLQTFADVMGVSTEKVIDLFQNDAAGAFQLFTEGLGKFGNEADVYLENAGILEAKAQRLFKAAGNTIGEALEVANKGFEDGEAHMREYDIMTNTLEASTKKLWNSLQVLGIELGSRIAPTLRSIVDIMHELFADSENRRQIVNLIVDIAKIAATLIAMKIAVSATKLAVGGLRIALGFLAVAGKKLFAIVGPMVVRTGILAGALVFASSGVGLLVVALTTLAGVISWLVLRNGKELIEWMTETHGKLDWLGAKFNYFWETIKIAGARVVQTLTVAFAAIPATIFDAFRAAWNALVPQFLEIETSMLEVVHGIHQAYENDIAAIQERQLQYYREAKQAADTYKSSVLELYTALSRNPFDTQRHVASANDQIIPSSGIGRLAPWDRAGGTGGAKPADEETEVETPNYFATQFSRLEQNNRELAKMDREAAEDRAEEAERIEREKQAALHSIQMQRLDEQGRAAAEVVAAEEQRASELRDIEEQKMENELEIYKMKLEGKEEFQIAHAERMNELELAIIEARRARDEAEMDRLLRAMELEIKANKKKEKQKAMDTIAAGAQAMSALGKQHTALARYIAEIRRAEALYDLAVNGPAMAKKAFGQAMGAYPPPIGYALGAAAAGAVLAQMAAAVNAVEGAKLPRFRDGGMVPGVASLTDSQLALVQPGEVMTPVKRYSDIEDGIRARMRREEGLGDYSLGAEREPVKIVVRPEEGIDHMVSVSADAAEVLKV